MSNKINQAHKVDFHLVYFFIFKFSKGYLEK